ncbi:MAG TPA: hypothetical protein VNZ68_00540 [Rhodocyclaceae bacterium]|nr:hypothetical protein [Rhodocyclaceae bacterium]
MKKILFASLLLGGLLGTGMAQAQAVVSGSIVVNDRHHRGGVYYSQPPAVYYGYPAPVYYGQPAYYAPRHHHYHPHAHGWHHRHHGHGHGHGHRHHGGHRHHHGGHHRH